MNKTIITLTMVVGIILAGAASMAQQQQPGTILIPNTGVRKYYYYAADFEQAVKNAHFNPITVEKIREEIERFRTRLKEYQTNNTQSFDAYSKTEKDHVFMLGLEGVYFEKISCGFSSTLNCLKKHDQRQTEIENVYKIGVKYFDIYKALK